MKQTCYEGLVSISHLDHVAINVGTDLDGAEAHFARLGFTLTPRGHHSLGSMNHLMMFAADYLELIAVPEGDTRRPDLRNAPVGINGIVLGADDVDAVFARLGELGFAGDPPRTFHRPVAFGEDTTDAHFRTVTVRSDVFSGGRVYFCHHLTPELVWQPTWQKHPNGAVAIAGVVVVSHEPEAEAANFASLVDAAVTDGTEDELVIELGSSHRLTVVSPARYGARYGELASAMGERRSIFGAVELRTVDGAAFRRPSESLDGVRITRPASDHTVLRVDAYHTVLDIRDIEPQAEASSATTGV